MMSLWHHTPDTEEESVRGHTVTHTPAATVRPGTTWVEEG